MPRIVNNGGVVNVGGELTLNGCVVGPGATIVTTDGITGTGTDGDGDGDED